MKLQSGNPKKSNTGSQNPSEPVFLLIGRLLRTHGLHGEIVMDLKTDFPERIKKGKIVYCGEEHKRLIVHDTRQHNRYILISFKGISSNDALQEYVNQFVFIRADEVEPLPQGHYYFHELIGMNVFENSKKIGVVSDMLETGSNDVIVVSTKTGKEILVPLIKGVVLSINKEEQKVVVKLPEWL
jgi:16S rRNA processing protein RimM